MALLLTGLIAVLAYAAIGHVRDSYRGYRELSRKSEDLIFLHTRLERETMSAEELQLDRGGVEIGHGAQRVRYEVGPSGGLLRKGEEREDRFNVQQGELKGYWRGRRVEQGRIDELVLDLELFGRSTRLRFHKRVDALTLMKADDGDRSQ